MDTARRSLVARQWQYVAAPIDRRYHNKPLVFSVLPARRDSSQKFGNLPTSIPPRTPSLRNGLARLLRPRNRDAVSFEYRLYLLKRLQKQAVNLNLFRRLSPLLSAEAQSSLSFTLAKTRQSIHGALFFSCSVKACRLQRSCACFIDKRKEKEESAKLSRNAQDCS